MANRSLWLGVIVIFYCAGSINVTAASFGDQCTSDSECIDVNTECVKYRECTIGTCQCQTGYGSTNDNGCDKQLSLYNQECGGTTGKICKETNQECSTTTGHCACATWKTYHTTAQACVTVTYKLLTEQCGGWWQEECIVTEANGGCCDSSDSTCQCKDGYTMNLTESYTACRAPHYGEYCNTPPQCVVAFDTSTISIDTSNIAPTCLDNMCLCPGSHELKNVLGYNLCLNTVEADHVYKQNGENCTHFNDCTSSLCVRCPGSSTGICMADSSDGHTAQLTNGCLLSIATYILVSLGLF